MKECNYMKLYRATYKIKWDGPLGGGDEVSQYILAPDFQTAGKLAETSMITSCSGGAGSAIVGGTGDALWKIEEIADDVCDIQDAMKLTEIGSYIFSIIGEKLVKVELLAIKAIR